jgi:hypothetical protein
MGGVEEHNRMSPDWPVILAAATLGLIVLAWALIERLQKRNANRREWQRTLERLREL